MTGGISTVIARLASEFCKNDHDVTIFVADRDNFLRQIEVVGDVPVYGMYLRAPISPQHFLRARDNVLDKLSSDHGPAAMADLVEETGCNHPPVSAAKYVLFWSSEMFFRGQVGHYVSRE